ncbi:hypothetical protein NQ314_003265 [Rhamnusium bicolor]|uniref:HAT C-terminal dimerisation domain-containing protein n=1 Tax=Rhamnusium bicolor TaxID=1586634 RepID=A0AAV8ZQW4_9CUCU|nr:hypothetical protein NQ314_003265 [Rhamnusium bicolor]
MKKNAQSVMAIYELCDKDIFPNCNILLQILLTLPVSVASAERSFSALKRLKTWQRNQMTQGRLLGLALLHIHLDLNIDIENVMNRFAKSKRRLEFII